MINEKILLKKLNAWLVAAEKEYNESGSEFAFGMYVSIRTTLKIIEENQIPPKIYLNSLYGTFGKQYIDTDSVRIDSKEV